jgi:hypothetical protein
MHVEVCDDVETMRHVPPLEYLIDKLDRDYRERADKLYWAVYESGREIPAEALKEIEKGFRQLCTALDHLARAARNGKGNGQAPEALRLRIDHCWSGASKALGSLDAKNFNRRTACNLFDRSMGETLFGCLTMVGDHLRRLVPLVAAVNPDIYEMLLDKLVVQEHPVNEETLKPIA